MRVLVTGHLGFIGPVVVRLLKEAGHYATGLDVGYFRECLPPGVAAVAPDREIVRDIRAVEARDLDGAEAIIHLAALSNDPMGALDPQLTYDINHRASVRLARLAKAAGIGRFVFSSSCSIYGAAGGERALDETAPFTPVSAYAVSKVRTEADLSELADDSFSPVFLRNATAYGVSPRIRFDLVVNNLMGWAQTTGTIRVLSDGTPWRPLVHTEDIARAALAAAAAPRAAVHNQPFNIGRSDANYRVRDIALAVQRAVPGARVEITGETGGDLRSYRVDFTKALTRLPDFAPQWSLERGIDELVRWFRDRKMSDEGFQGRLYIRLKQLQHLRETDRIDETLRPRAPL
ncbi:MAG: NAD-dependent epimerase/dehydratase family protein [Acetobacteraceae bacterium]